jgi:hypothetical protein
MAHKEDRVMCLMLGWVCKMKEGSLVVCGMMGDGGDVDMKENLGWV